MDERVSNRSSIDSQMSEDSTVGMKKIKKDPFYLKLMDKTGKKSKPNSRRPSRRASFIQ